MQDRFTNSAIEKALCSLRNQGLVNDSTFAKQWREQRERYRPKGPAIISQELRKLGVDREVIQDALSGFDSAANAYKAGSKYASKLSAANHTVFKRKLGGFLQRRGFNGEVLGQTVERIWSELFDPLGGTINGDSQYDYPPDASPRRTGRQSNYKGPDNCAGSYVSQSIASFGVH